MLQNHQNSIIQISCYRTHRFQRFLRIQGQALYCLEIYSREIWVFDLEFYEGWIIVIDIILIESTLNVLDIIQILSMDEKCPKINPN